MRMNCIIRCLGLHPACSLYLSFGARLLRGTGFQRFQPVDDRVVEPATTLVWENQATLQNHFRTANRESFKYGKSLASQLGFPTPTPA